MSSQHAHDLDHNVHDARASQGFTRPGQALARVAGATGNRAFAQVVARMRDGEGILPGGTVHPDVEATIKASRGSGHPLGSGLRATLEHRLGAPLSDVRIHTDERAAGLARAVSARAFAVGSDIYFGRHEFGVQGDQPSELVTHEVAHVLQQRGAPVTGPLTVSEPGDPAELEAEAIARDVSG